MTVVQTQAVPTTIIQTVTVAAPVPSSSDAIAASTSTSIPSLESRLRRQGDPATQPQIDATCADPNNLVLNPYFAKRDDGSVPGWNVDTNDPNISVDSIPNPNSPNATIASFKSAEAGLPLTITQSLTLCPDTQYAFSAHTRQANAYAGCVVAFVLKNGNATKTILTVTPQESELKSSGFFTSGSGVESAAVDLKITGRCDGYGGVPVSNEDGYMVVDVGGISVIKDDE
jgi:hypothetical protein